MNLRKQKVGLGQAEAARRLRLKNRQQLWNYEHNRTLPSAPILIEIAKLYNEPPEDFLARAYWPQLVLLPLVSIMNPEILSKDIIKELEKGLEEKERLELTSFIKKLLSKRIAVEQYR